MKWLFSALAVLVAAVVTAAAGAGSATTLPTPQTFASWQKVGDGSFVESIAYGKDGHVYASRTIWGATNTGEIDRVPLTGGPVRAVASFDAGETGMFLGLALDERNNLYVTYASGSESVPSAVFRVEGSGRLTPVLYLPDAGFPNGLAARDGYLYVTDSALGAIWRGKIGPKPATETSPWMLDDALAPVSEIGIDGIAFRGPTMYVTQYDLGQILVAHLNGNGTAGPLQTLADDPALVTADGIAFDPLGNLWVTVNEGRLAYVTHTGTVVVAADGVPWLDYPTQVVFGARGMYVANGSFDPGMPSIVGWRIR